MEKQMETTILEKCMLLFWAIILPTVGVQVHPRLSQGCGLRA